MKHPCKIFGCTPEQLRAQYARNAAQLREMAAKAFTSGLKVNGFTGAELAQMASKAETKAKEPCES